MRDVPVKLPLGAPHNNERDRKIANLRVDGPVVIPFFDQAGRRGGF